MKVMADVDWPSFMRRHDMTWSYKPMTWDEGAFLGNGLLGAMVYCEEHKEKRNVLRFVLGRSDVVAHKPGGKGGYPPRVPVGELDLELKGWIYQPFTMRLDLWNAELRAEIQTTVGTVRLRAFVHSEEPVLAIELETSPEEEDAAFRWYAHQEIHPVLINADGVNMNQYLPKGETDRVRHDQVTVGTVRFNEREGCTTAWTECSDRGVRRFYLSIQNGASEPAKERACRAVTEASQRLWKEWVEAHRSWWHSYYPLSFVSLPDTLLESFYWIQMYKLASATRADGMLMDNQGPWLAPTPWAGVWFNMNVQMAYSPVYASNRLEMGESLVKAFREHFDNLIENVPEPYRLDSAGLGRSCSYDLVSKVSDEVGNLIWVCHSLWRHYRHSMDEALLKELVIPLLKRGVQYYLHLLQEGEDGCLHLPPMVSPEYGSFLKMTVPDTHYDLALLRWGCETLLSAAPEEEPMRNRWQEVLERLVPFPVDDTGFMIGSGQPLEFGHRHFSHLLAVFPLHLLSGDSEEERALIIKSLRHWLSMEGDLRGFTFTGAASIAAALGLGDEALRYLQTFLHMIKPNTMYREAGPVIESPLAAAEAIHDMLLQSWGGIIRVFPAVPSAWQEATFHELRAEGAFLISAERSGGSTKWVRIKSLTGQPCRVKLDADRVAVYSAEASFPAVLNASEGMVTLEFQPGEEVLLHPVKEAQELAAMVRAVREEAHLTGYFGGRKPWRLYGLPIS